MFTPVCSAVNFSLNEVFIHLTITIITQIQTAKERDEYFFSNSWRCRTYDVTFELIRAYILDVSL